MEILDGETLAARLTRGALPLDQALRHAIEIAGALDKAIARASSIATSSRQHHARRRRARSCSTSAWPSVTMPAVAGIGTLDASDDAGRT